MYKGIGNNLYSIATRSLKTAKQRVLFAVSVFVILFAILIIRLAQIMVFDNSKVTDRAYTNYGAPLSVSRADIVDRNGIIIATSLPTVSLYACPHEMINLEEAAEKIVKIIDTVEPDEELAAEYDKRYSVFKEIYPQCKALFQKMA